MLLLSIEKLLQGRDWLYEVKLDAYRALAIKSSGRVQLRSENDNDFTTRYAPITAALRALPDETVIDGEVVALLAFIWSPPTSSGGCLEPIKARSAINILTTIWMNSISFQPATLKEPRQTLQSTRAASCGGRSSGLESDSSC
jgi:bifunctional non-homologous end joining protein LigD